MKQITVKLITFVFLLLIGINGHSKEGKSKNENVNYVKYVDEIVRGFSKEMKKDFGLVFIGSGGRMSEDVDAISVRFLAYQRAGIEEARELEVKSTEKLLKMINEHKKIRSYLREYPFVSKRVNVSISFKDPNNRRYVDGSVAVVSNVNGKVYYDKAEPSKTDITEELIDMHEETYEEALKIVNEGKNMKQP
jgi:hypothetical protein